MATRIRRTRRRTRVFALAGILSIVAGLSLSVVGPAGAEGEEPFTDTTEMTTPPVEETTPPVEETTPPVEETTPPVEETTPVDETTPPAESTTSSLAVANTSEDGIGALALFDPCDDGGVDSTKVFESDTRATGCFEGNFTHADCTTEFAFHSGEDDDAEFPGTFTVVGTEVNITSIDPGVTISIIAVKAGDGYNIYPGNVLTDLIGPYKYNQGKDEFQLSGISHFVACYDLEAANTTFTVDKTIADGSQAFPGDTEFVIEVTCTPPEGDAITGTFTFDENGVLIDAESDELPMVVPDGSDCTATETGDGDPDEENCTVSTSVDGTPWEGQGDPSKTVEGVDGETVVFENSLACEGEATFSVDKTIADSSDAFPGDTEFVIEVTCTPPEGDAITGTFTFDENGVLIDAESDELPMVVPEGSDCTATETGDGDPDEVGCSVSTSVDGTPWEGQGDPSKLVEDVDGETVVFENSLVCVADVFTVGIDVEKRIVGTASPTEGSTFVVELTCTVDGNPLAVVPTTQSFTWASDFPGAPQNKTSVTKSFTASIEQGDTPVCTLEETDTGGTHLVGYYVNGVFQGDDPIPVTLEQADRDLVTVENDPTATTTVGGLSVTREVLPFTGSFTDILLKSAVWMLVIGGAAFLISRRRRSTRSLEA